MVYRREIDGLRAVALLPVMLFHTGAEAFGGGFIGVDVFFVISGYLITSIILNDMEKGEFSLLNFYERRARRILPALFFVMFVSILVAFFWLLPSDMLKLSQSIIAASVFLSNIFFWRDSGYFDSGGDIKPLLHTWSLSVEEQYYILFPIMFFLGWRLGKPRLFFLLIIASTVSFCLAEWGSLVKPRASFYLLPTRCWEILVGGLISFVCHNNNINNSNHLFQDILSAIGLLLILIPIFIYDKQTPYPGVCALLPIIGTSIIIVFCTDQTIVGRIFGSGVFVGIGLISYSAYLWHQPIFAFIRASSVNEPSTAILFFAAIFSMLIAYISWKYIELPFRDKNKFSRSSVFVFGFVGSVIFITFGILGHVTDGYQDRVGEEVRLSEQALRDKNPRQKECYFIDENFRTPEQSCILGNGKVVGALVGDSHADALSFAVEELLSERNLGLLSLTYSGCPPIMGIYRVDVFDNHKCYEYNKKAYDYILGNNEIKYVIMASRWTIYLEKTRFDNREGGLESGSELYIDIVDEFGVKKINNEQNRKRLIEEAYRNSIEKLLSAGKKVFLVYPVPEVGFDVPKYKAKYVFLERKNYQLSTRYDVFIERNAAVLRVFDSIKSDVNLIRIRPDIILCNTFVKDRCVTEINDNILYYDNNHLTNSGAKYIINKIKNVL